MWDNTAVIKPPYPITYPCFCSHPHVPSLFSCFLWGVTDSSWLLLTPGPPPCSTLTPIVLPVACCSTSSPFVLSSTPNHVLHLPSLVLLQPTPVSIYFSLPAQACPGQWHKGNIWWIRLSQIVHRKQSPLLPALYNGKPAHRHVLAYSISNRIVVP